MKITVELESDEERTLLANKKRGAVEGPLVIVVTNLSLVRRLYMMLIRYIHGD